MMAIVPPMTTKVTMNENTVNESVVGPDEFAGGTILPTPNPKKKFSDWFRIIGLVLFVAALYGALNIPLSYYAISPGQATDVEPLVKVEKGPSYPSDGKIFLTTVSLGQATLFEIFQGWLDPSVDIFEEAAIRPPSVSEDELTKINLQYMASSKETALGVAFEYLGYDAITGEGAEVAKVEKGSPADQKLGSGDVIIEMDGESVKDHLQLVKAVKAVTPGDAVQLKVKSGEGEIRAVDIELGTNPDNMTQGFLGVALSTSNLSFDFPYDVKLESEDIGGPSAGLAFTLQILDSLTEGDLANGNKVAITGTIELDGSVGEVGGIRQKAIAVRDAGADIFLVPFAEVGEITSIIGDKVRVIGVNSIKDAVETLKSLGGEISVPIR